MKYKYFYVFFFGIILQLFLVAVWFHRGYVLATGEGGIYFYNFDIILQMFGQTWFTGAIGFPGTGLPLINIPFFSLLNFFHTSGLSYLVLQESFFFIMQVVGMFAIYFLTERVISSFPERKKIVISAVAALFYVFNQINLVIVLNRFQYPFMFLYALLPLVLFITLVAIQKRNYFYMFLLQAIFFIFASAFSSLPSIMLVWILLLIISIYHFLFQSKNWFTAKFLIIFFILNIISWVFVNSWWILPFLKVVFESSYVTQVAYNPHSDLSDLTVLSKVLGNLSYVFRLMHHDYYIWMQDVWNGYFQNPLVILLSFFPPAFVFGSLLVKKKFPFFYFFIFLSLLSIFFVKGIAAPFGEVFYFLFTHTRFLEGFRNPFEKISIILPLFYSIPFAYGVYGLYELSKKRVSKFWANILFIAVLIICFGVLCFPIWNGQVFVGYAPPANNPRVGFSVDVPAYYTTANNWLNKQNDDFRVIALPIGDEGIAYTWPYGYSGVEVSNGLFSKSFISYCTTIQFLCENTKSLQPLLMQYPQDFWKVLSPLGVRYIMLRKDTNYFYDQMQNPVDLESKLATIPQIKKTASFGPLSFYLGDSSYNTPKIFAATQGIAINGVNSFIQILPFANYQQGDVYFTDANQFDLTERQTHQIVVKAKEFIPSIIHVSPENALNELPYVRWLPGSPLYFLGRTKEGLTNFIMGSSNFSNKIEQSDKRVVEVYRLVQVGKPSLANKTIVEYKKLLDNFLQNTNQFTEDKFKEDILRQRYVLDDILTLAQQKNENSSLYTESSFVLDQLLKQLSLKTMLPVDLSKYRSYIVTVPKTGNYTIKLTNQDYTANYDNSVIQGVLDATHEFSASVSSDQFTILGTLFLSKGLHQIDLLAPKGDNLINQTDSKLTTKKIPNQIGIFSNSYTIPISSLHPFDRYTLSFDYKIDSGGFFQAFFQEDTDPINHGQVTPHYNLDINLKKQRWYHFSITINPNQISHNAKIVINLYPGNDCLKRNSKTPQKCNDIHDKRQYDIPTIVEMKNLSFQKNDMGDLFLEKENTISNSYKAPEISFKKINPARYIISVKGATTPFYLSFLEAFHPMWKLYYIVGKQKIAVDQKSHILINSYANAWRIEKLGTYNLLLEFSPQSLLELGTVMTKLSILVLVVTMFFYFIFRNIIKRRKK